MNNDVLVENLVRTREWTLLLIADLDGDDWHFQPAPGMGHALWICGHLAVAQHLLVHVRCLNGGVLPDEFVNHFPIGALVRAASEHRYPKVDEVKQALADVHEQTVAAVGKMSAAQLGEAAYGADGATHPHYADKRGAIVHCARHEAFHAGQIASIRRQLGKSFLR